MPVVEEMEPDNNDQKKKIRKHIILKHRTRQVVNKSDTPKTKERKRKHSNGNQEGVRLSKDDQEFKKPKTVDIRALSESFFHKWEPNSTSTQESVNRKVIL